MGAHVRISDIENPKELRRAARELVGRYHEEQLGILLEHVRDGFQKLDTGEIDPFDLDDLIHHYKRSAQKLWSFCNSTGSGGERAARALEWNREHDEGEPDWWELGRPRRRHD
jgi:hypothetical protein